MGWNKIGVAIAGILGGAMWMASASATPLPAVGSLAVDFRTSDWSGANGQNSFTVDGITVSTDETICVIGACFDGRDLSQGTNQQEGGLGIDTILPLDETDEIDGSIFDEVLTITFDVARSLTGVWITNLFPAPDGPDDGGEFVRLIINDSLTEVFGPSDQSDGGYFIGFGGPVSVSKIVFKADFGYGNDYSVAGFTAVPEPATLVLIGFGLLGLGLVRRRAA